MTQNHNGPWKRCYSCSKIVPAQHVIEMSKRISDDSLDAVISGRGDDVEFVDGGPVRRIKCMEHDCEKPRSFAAAFVRHTMGI